ncbi:MAG: Do family serine endopeptidase [Rhizobiaceae bacterium]|nr:Do family serine endopeptidase [Rhizobiaceae bacterium]
MLKYLQIGLILLATAVSSAGLVNAQQQDGLFDKALDQLLRRGDNTGSEAQVLQVPSSRAEIQLSFAPLVKQVSGSVVNVYAARRPARTSPFAGDPFFERFFGRRAQPRNQNSLGSGVIVSTDGVVVTNHHVIKDADEVKIALADGREYEAAIILKDEASDLAILKVDEGDIFQAIEIGDSEEALVGDLVLAIGNPFGVGQTVTSGIISAVARSTSGVSDFGFFLQTDAAINPGNSGGALIDMQGRLIGINTAIYSRSGGSNGIGFAIPSNMVRVAISSSETGDTLRRPWIGATFQPVSAEIAQSLGMARPRGALVVGVVDGGPADQAGIRIGDVILGVNGSNIPHINALDYRLTTVGIGNLASFNVLSRGREVEREIELMLAPETVPANETEMPARSALGGAVVANLSPALTQRIKLPADKEGVVVMSVQRGSPASANRIRPGDIIRAINQVPVNRVADVEPILQEGGRRWIFEIERQGREYVLDRNGGFFRQYTR